VSWEYENGKFRLTYRPTKPKPVEEYVRAQGRFSHLGDKEIGEMQRMVDEEWKYWEEMDREGRIILPWVEAPRK
jgi:pyruvate/2-oxoacid:ferredoxin oxidoreductase beta subunit